MNEIILIGAAHCGYLAFLVLTKKPRRLADYFLAEFFGLVGMLFGGVYYALTSGQDDVLLLFWNVSMLLGPLFYVYVSILIDPESKWRPSYLWHATPFVVSTAYMEFRLATWPDDRIVAMFEGTPFSSRPITYQFFYLVEELIFPAYLLAAYVVIRRHQRRIQGEFSYKEGVDLAWLTYLIVGLGIATLATQSTFYLANPGTVWDQATALRYGFTLATGCVFYLGYFGFRQGAIFTPLPAGTRPSPIHSGHTSEPVQPASPTAKYERSGLDAAASQTGARRLAAFMDEYQPHLDDDLSLRSLAERVGMTRHHMSQVINEHFGESFYDFANRYRVDAVKRALAVGGHSHRTLLAVAHECGFKSKASFNRAFKKVTGQTPRQYANDRSRTDGAPPTTGPGTGAE